MKMVKIMFCKKETLFVFVAEERIKADVEDQNV